MKIFKKVSTLVALVVVSTLGLTGPMAAFAATTPVMGATNTFAILASTYTNTIGITTIT
ncbi:MAG: hypothetical protein NTZ65_03365 [Candidatus Berkelbacteria bacterium]|nr:hypothetical protein [Candidatus Berkelbacteria bacterium]